MTYRVTQFDTKTNETRDLAEARTFLAASEIAERAHRKGVVTSVHGPAGRRWNVAPGRRSGWKMERS